MAITLGELLIKLTAKTDAFQKGMGDAKKLAFDSSGDIVASLGRIGESLGKLKFDNLNQVAASLNRVGGIVAGVAVGIATASIAAAEHVALQAKEIDKLSQSYGLSVQQISSFRVAAQITGVSLDTITSGMSRLAKNAATVAESVGGSSSKGAGAAFKALGISITPAKLQTANMNDLLGEVAEKFSKLSPGVEKTALAIQIFGKGGAALIPVLNEGKEGLDRLRQVSDELGLTWTEKDIQAGAQFAESVALIKLKGQALEEQFSKGLIPALDQISTAFAKVDSKGNSAAQSAGSGIGDVFKTIAKAVLDAGYGIDFMILKLEKLNNFVANNKGLSKLFFGPLGGSQFAASSRSSQEIDNTLDALTHQYAEAVNALNAPLKTVSGGSTTRTGNVPSLGGPEQIKNWNEIAEILKQINDEELKLSKTTTAEILELEERITKELRDQHALKDFPVNLKFNPVVPQQSPDNTTRDQFNADRLKKYNDSLKDTQNLLGLQASIFEQTETSAQKYNFALQQLGVLLQKRLIDQETFNRAVNNLGTLSSKGLDGARAFFQQYADAAKETGRQVYDALSNAFEGINNSLAEMIVKGKADWKSLFDDIETSIVKISLQKVEGAIIGKLFGGSLGSKSNPMWIRNADDSKIFDTKGQVPLFGGNKSEGAQTGIDGIFSKFTSGLEDLFKSLGSFLADVFKSIGSIFQKLFSGGGGGNSGGGAAGVIGDLIGTIFGGGLASGGPARAGVLYRVNENHTEYFKPNVSGRVIPLGGEMAMAGGGVTHYHQWNITTPDADSFRKSASQIANQFADQLTRSGRRR